MFIDYSGDRLGIVDPHTGEIREAELFVATLGASNYTYAEVTWTQQLEDWIGSHVRALNFIGGCIEILVPDNLKSGVHKADFYDPVLDRTYGEMAAHLLHGDHPGTQTPAPRQGEGRAVGTPGAALDPGTAAQPAAVQPRRSESRHRRAARRPEQQAIQEAARLSPQHLRGARSPGTSPTARKALPLRAVEGCPCRH
ncbi:hypothetical protein OKW34_003348 [Paraburkholderia youngii]